MADSRKILKRQNLFAKAFGGWIAPIGRAAVSFSPSERNFDALLLRSALLSSAHFSSLRSCVGDGGSCGGPSLPKYEATLGRKSRRTGLFRKAFVSLT
jgi:hypothetical protein